MPDAIKEIVKTYNLPSRINSLVLRIAYANIQRLCLTSFNDQYRYVAELVDKFQATREDRNAVSLDSPISDDGRTWYDVLSYEQNPYEDEEGLTLGSAVDISDRFLVERHREMTRRLLGESNPQNITDLTSDELFADFFGISLRSEAVVRYLEHGGRIYPERRMVYVNLDSENPFIQWKPRNYNGNPLDYFKRHQDVYGWMSRGNLARFDCGLYTSLRKYAAEQQDGVIVKQLELAIPNKKRRDYRGNPLTSFSENEECKGLSRWELYKNHRHLYDALQRAGKLDQAIQERRRKPYSQDKIVRILEAYSLYGGNCNLAARNLELEPTNVHRIWKSRGLKAMGKPERLKSQKVV